jgi:hypothetical protein
VIRRESGGGPRIDPQNQLRWKAVTSTVKIGGTERLLRDADAPWIRQAVEPSTRISELPCVRVFIQTGNVNLDLQTQNCEGGTGGGGQPPSPEEEEILSLWNMEGLSSAHFTARQVTNFVEHVRRILRSSRHRSGRPGKANIQKPSFGKGSDGRHQKR